MKEIKIAQHSGFCFGVKRAENLVLKALEENSDSKIYTLGPLIHNPLVVKKLEDLGVFAIDETKVFDLPEGTTIVIRSHGIDKYTKEKLYLKNYNIVDATCPFVKKAKEAAMQFTELGYTVLILGDKNHPEVKGIHSYTDYKGIIFKDIEELNEILKKTDKNIGLVAQTTQNNELFKKIVNILQNKIKDFKYYNTICSATSLRQESSIKLAEKSEITIVIGGKNSANTKRLVEICQKICKNVLWIEKAEDICLKKLKNFNKIAITAGASTPLWCIENTCSTLENYFKGEENLNDE